jgi:predicted permease
LLTEAFLLACFGAMAGVPLALWARRALFLLMPATEYPISLDVPLNASVLIFTVLLCMLVTIVSGAAPALHAVRQELVNALKEGGRSGSAGAGTHRMRDLLVIGEVALALVALVGAGLFSKSFRAATAMDPGFDPKNMLVAKFFLSPSGYTDPAQRADFMLRLKDRLEATPGVIHAGYSESIPLGFGGAPGCGVDVPGYVPPRGESRAVDRNLVSPGFYKTLNVRMLSGRDFGPQDDARSAPVAIVSQSFAQHYFGGRDPVGQKINGCGVEVTIVGVSSEVKYYSFTQPLRPMIVVPLQQRYTPIHDYDRGLGVFIRTTGDPNQALPILRRAVASLDPAVGVYNAMAFEDYMGASVFPQRIAANLLTVLGCIALLLAAVGLYSVMAYSVSQRTHEIGIRMALGGQRSRVLGLVLKKGLALAFVGLTAGVVAALSVSQVAASMLLGVSATDPAIFAGASVFLLAIALVASLLPARRATKVDPMIALHCE